MTYLHKLASRIARLRPFVPVILFAAACVKGDKTEFLSPNPNPNTPALHDIRVEPQITSIRSGTETMFTATGYSASGQVVPVTVDWVATGGSIWPDGRFVGDITGNFSVTARVRNLASISDSARVNVWDNPNEIVEIMVFPDSAVVQEGDTLQANAVLRLANGDLAPNAAVQWTASSSASVDEAGRFTAGQSGSYVLSAQAMNGLRASAPVFVRKRELTLTSLQVTPPTASPVAGQILAFSALATWSDGSSDLADVVWSATGGTIASSGVYTAGSRAGQYIVVAKQRHGPVADTAFISIQPPIIASVTLSPKTLTVQSGATQQFTAQALMSDASHQTVPVTWQTTTGTIDASGLFTAGGSVGGFLVIVHVVGGAMADTALVTVTQPVATISQLLLNPSAASVPKGSPRQFSVTATWSDGSSSVPVVSWAATGGTVSGSGLYTAGSTPGTYRVIATSGSGTADTSAVTVTAPVLTQMALSPAAAALLPSQTIQFGVTGTYSDGSTSIPVVSWLASGGSISPAGLYTAGAAAGTYAVIATAQGTGLADTSFVTIGIPPAILTSLLLTPASVALAPGAGQEFHVIGTYSDGSTGTPAVTYAVTGGTMSGNHYTAGSTSGNYRVIATELGGTHADTSAVLITSPVTLTSLVLAPDPVVLPTAGTMQFSVSATWSNGTTGQPSLAWSATGGTVSSNGLYTAGSTGGTYRVIAAQVGGTLADTSVVTISSTAPPPALTLTSLSVSPKTTAVAVGGIGQFAALGHYSDGSTGAVAVNWSANGGVITAGGFFTAGMTAGSYFVIATQQGGTKVDTAFVTVSLTPPPPSTAFPNQPSGMTLLTQRAFDAKVENGWHDRGDNAFSIVQDPTAPRSALNVGQALYDPMMHCGTGPIQTNYMWSQSLGTRTMYVGFWLKMDPVWYGNKSNVNKVLFFYIAGGNKVIAIVNGIGTGTLHAQISLQAMGVPRPPIPPSTIPDVSWNAYANMNTASSVIPRGQWVFWEVVLGANTPGVLDGTVDYWLNGVQIGHYTNVGYSSATQTGDLNVFYALDWNPTYGGGCNGTSTNGVPDAPQFPVPQWMRLDHIYVSGK